MEGYTFYGLTRCHNSSTRDYRFKVEGGGV